MHGPNADRENTWSYIQEALDAGYNVEVDVWYKDGQFWLGHDAPSEAVSLEQLAHVDLWLHCKNAEALSELIKINLEHMNYFWHESDERTLTSQGWVWTSPGKSLTHNSIAVLPELHSWWDISYADGYCSDYIATILDRIDDE